MIAKAKQKQNDSELGFDLDKISMDLEGEPLFSDIDGNDSGGGTGGGNRNRKKQKGDAENKENQQQNENQEVVQETKIEIIESVSDGSIPKLESATAILKVLAPKDITLMSNIIGGSSKVSLTKIILEQSEHFLTTKSKDWSDKFNLFFSPEVLGSIKKNYNMDGLELTRLANPDENILQIFKRSKNNSTIEPNDKNKDQKAKPTNEISKNSTSTKSEVQKPPEVMKIEIIDPNQFKDIVMPDIFGTQIANILKLITPESVSKMAQGTQSKNKTSLTSILADESSHVGTSSQVHEDTTDNGNLNNKNDDVNNEGINSKSNYVDNYKSKKSSSNENKKTKESFEYIVDLNKKTTPTTRPTSQNNSINNDDSDSDDPNQSISSSLFFLQEKEKMKRAENKILKNTFINSYKNISNKKSTKKPNLNLIKKQEDGDEDGSEKFEVSVDSLENQNQNQNESESKEDNLNQGTLFDKKQY